VSFPSATGDEILTRFATREKCTRFVTAEYGREPASHEKLVSVFLHAFIAIASCMVIGYVASLAIGRRPDPAALRGLTLWDLAEAK